MRKNEMETGDIVAEVLALLEIGIYIGLQIFYKNIYNTGVGTLMYHLCPVLLVYAGMLTMQSMPELLNGAKSEPLEGKVRFYAVRMIRVCKLLFMTGFLVPSVADVCGIEINAAISLILMASVILVVAYYLYRIWKYNSSQRKS